MLKVAIITGASRGIGKEIAKKFAREGIIVVANYNKSEGKAKELRQELQAEGIEIDIFKADVTKKNEIKQMVDYVLGKYKKIDILVNNAGISQIKMFTDITDKDIDNMLDVNLKSIFYVTQEVLLNMIHNKSGVIINISSVWGIIGASCEVLYSSTKARNNRLYKSISERSWTFKY